MHGYSFFAVLLVVTQLAKKSESQTVILNGGGAAFALPVYEKWWTLWATKKPVTVMYKGIGSYFGKRWIRGEPLQDHEIGEKIVFAGTDFPLTEKDYREFPQLQMIPVIAGALMIAYNVPGVIRLRLTREVLTDIYWGRIQYWNDPRLQSVNVHTMLPHKRIQVLSRRDEAGGTETLTKGLSLFDEEWAAGPGVFKEPKLIRPEGPSENWPVNGTQYYTYTDVGMSTMILSIPYSIGYVSVAESLEWGLKVASLENKHGETITPEMVETGVNIAMRFKAKDLGERMVADLIDAPEHKAYPLATFTYLLGTIHILRHHINKVRRDWRREAKGPEPVNDLTAHQN